MYTIGSKWKDKISGLIYILTEENITYCVFVIQNGKLKRIVSKNSINDIFIKL